VVVLYPVSLACTRKRSRRKDENGRIEAVVGLQLFDYCMGKERRSDLEGDRSNGLEAGSATYSTSRKSDPDAFHACGTFGRGLFIRGSAGHG
jgi:hypothetical protein